MVRTFTIQGSQPTNKVCVVHKEKTQVCLGLHLLNEFIETFTKSDRLPRYILIEISPYTLSIRVKISILRLLQICNIPGNRCEVTLADRPVPFTVKDVVWEDFEYVRMITDREEQISCPRRVRGAS